MGRAAGRGSTWQGGGLKDDSISMRTRESWSICIPGWLIDCTASMGTAAFDSATGEDRVKMSGAGLQGVLGVCVCVKGWGRSGEASVGRSSSQ